MACRPVLQAGQPTGYDVIVITDNTPVWGFLKQNGWLIPLDHSMMTNFGKYASPLVKNPRWDPGNRYGMAWQSVWTAVGYNSSAIPDPGDSIQILFDKKYAGHVGMMSDPQELGSAGLLALGIEPAASTYDDWKKAAALLQRQKSEGIVRAATSRCSCPGTTTNSRTRKNSTPGTPSSCQSPKAPEHYPPEG